MYSKNTESYTETKYTGPKKKKRYHMHSWKKKSIRHHLLKSKSIKGCNALPVECWSFV